ncbi:unnamed protein product [marine sediment metagenome]|uniref:Uncharacterized protein n=1 Tax=marine sediment metagenome TaxID=412755 RepID=X0ZIS1_9ZZZZ
MQEIIKKDAGVKRSGYDLLVELFQGVIEESRLMSPEKAKKVVQTWCDNHGYVDFDGLQKAIEEGMPDNELRWFTGIIAEPDSYGATMCVECGRSVKGGSGYFVNRVPVCDDLQTKIDGGRPFPEGEYECAECDSARDRLPMT